MKEKLKYKVYSFRLNKKTYNLLKKIKEEYGKSWNLFIYNVLVEWVNLPHNKNNYRKIFHKEYTKNKKDYCEECGVKIKFSRVGHYTRSNLIVHHIDKDITNSKDNNLRTLCVNCHSD